MVGGQTIKSIRFTDSHVRCAARYHLLRLQWFIDFKHMFSEGTCDMLSPAKKITFNMLKPSICLMETRRKNGKSRFYFSKNMDFPCLYNKNMENTCSTFPKNMDFPVIHRYA